VRELNRALVLGAAGFLGRRLVTALAADGVHVDALDLEPIPSELLGLLEVPSEPLTWTRDDVVTTNLVHLIRRTAPDVVFHLANTSYIPPSFDDPLTDLTTNVRSTVRLLEALRPLERGPHLLFVSSAAVYGEAMYAYIDEKHPLRPISPYGISKMTAEHYLSFYSQAFDISATSVRLFPVYGPGQRKQVVYDLARRILEGQDPVVIGANAQVFRDFVFLDDAVRALVRLGREAPGDGSAFNVASGNAVSLDQLARALSDIAGKTCDIHFTGTLRPGDVTRWCGDARRARSLGVECPTPLADGLRQTIAWLTLDQVGATSASAVAWPVGS
jgi:nucleoside-diphosphate-sugar epimerase